MSEIKPNHTTPIDRVMAEIETIKDKKSKLYFYVYETDGVPSGHLQYIYNLAMIAHKGGYDTTILYQLEKEQGGEFIGVKKWLGEEYGELKYENVADGNVGMRTSDILFIPEIFANVMVQTRKMPCKRVAILQNFDYLIDQTPMGSQWGDYGIMECIVPYEGLKEKLHDIFPYVQTHAIPPYIHPVFGETSAPKRLEINIIAADPYDVKKVVKPFYWKFPGYRWVSFKDLREMTKEGFAKELRECPLTIWIDKNASFGYSALEAVNSGSYVFGYLPTNILPWAFTKDDKGRMVPSDACVWFDNYDALYKMIAGFVRSWLTDQLPEDVLKVAKDFTKDYTLENTTKEFLSYIDNKLAIRQKELERVKEKMMHDLMEEHQKNEPQPNTRPDVSE